MDAMTPPRDDDIWIGLTIVQREFFKALTDQRVANILHAADLVGEMDADAAQFLRYLNRPDAECLRKFLLQAKPETLEFLTELRKREIEDIGGAIETALAIRRTFRFMRWGLATFIGALITMLLLWEKFVAFFKPGAGR